MAELYKLQTSTGLNATSSTELLAEPNTSTTYIIKSVWVTNTAASAKSFTLNVKESTDRRYRTLSVDSAGEDESREFLQSPIILENGQSLTYLADSGSSFDVFISYLKLVRGDRIAQ